MPTEDIFTEAHRRHILQREIDQDRYAKENSAALAESKRETATLAAKHPGAAARIAEVTADREARARGEFVPLKLTRAQYDALPAGAQALHLQRGGIIREDSARSGNVLTRAQFDALSMRAKAEHCRKGGQVA